MRSLSDGIKSPAVSPGSRELEKRLLLIPAPLPRLMKVCLSS